MLKNTNEKKSATKISVTFEEEFVPEFSEKCILYGVSEWGY